MPWRTRRGRWLVFYIPYLILAIAMGFGLHLVSDKADKADLSAERQRAISSDCESRVDAREVLRDVIREAYATTNASPEVQALIEQRRDALLLRVPPLRCTTVAGISTPTPITTPERR